MFNMFEELYMKTKQVKLKQPALADEKPEDDDVAVDVGLEKPDFKKKSDPKKLDGMEIVPDKLLLDHAAVREAVINELHDLVMELDDISEEQRALLTQAFEDGFIENVTPTVEEMVNQLVDSGQISANDEHGEDTWALMQGLSSEGQKDVDDSEFKTQLVDAWVRMVVIPKVEGKYGKYDTGDQTPVESLQICNDCAKGFRAVETICVNCKSANTEKVTEEQEYDEKLGYDRDQWALMMAIEEQLGEMADGYDDYGVFTTETAEDVMDWIEANEPEVYQIILADPEEIPEKGSEAFFAAMEALGIAKMDQENFEPDEDDVSGRQDVEAHFNEFESANNLTVPEKHQLRIARDTLKMSDAGANIMGGPTKAEARAIIKKLTGKDVKETGEQTTFDGMEQDDSPFALRTFWWQESPDHRGSVAVVNTSNGPRVGIIYTDEDRFEGNTDWPIKYDDGKLAFDYPEFLTVELRKLVDVAYQKLESGVAKGDPEPEQVLRHKYDYKGPERESKVSEQLSSQQMKQANAIVKKHYGKKQVTDEEVQAEVDNINRKIGKGGPHDDNLRYLMSQLSTGQHPVEFRKDESANEGEGDYEVLGRSFQKQEDADRIAREKGGQVVADSEDNERFMVIKKKEAM